MGVAGGLADGMVAMQNDDKNAEHLLEEARKQFYILDVDGLMTQERPDEEVMSYQKSFANSRIRCEGNVKEGASLLQVIERAKPDVLIGLCGFPNTIT